MTTSYTSGDLDMAERHVAQGERHIAQQVALIARMGEHGLDTQEAKQLLGLMQEMQQEHCEHREAIAAALEANKEQ